MCILNLKDTKEGILVYGGLNLDQFIKLNEDKLDTLKNSTECPCVLHNEFCELSRHGLKFNEISLREFYDLYVNTRGYCNDFKEAVAVLAENEEARNNFLKSFN